jgi:hypothetical protein
MKKKKTKKNYPYDVVMKVAQETADVLGIMINDPASIMENMTSIVPMPTILENWKYTLWIDKHYIAYAHNFKPEVSYVIVGRGHILEELRSVCKRLQDNESSVMLASIKSQLEFAKIALAESRAIFTILTERRERHDKAR